MSDPGPHLPAPTAPATAGGAAMPYRYGVPPAIAPGPVTRALSQFWKQSRHPVRVRTLGLSGAVGVLAGGLLVGHRPGLGVAVVGLAIWSAAVPLLLSRKAYGDLVTAALSVALVAVAAVRDAPWVVALSLLAGVGLAAVAATSARSAPAVLLSPATAAAGVLRAVPWLRRGIGSSVGTRREQAARLVRSVAVTAVLLLVFGLLFASADTVFASYLPTFDVGRLPAQLVVGAVVALLAATLAHLVIAPPGWSDLRAPAARPARLAEWLLPVVALDVLVLAFDAVQLGSLLGGHRHVLETAGLTYAQYARQGFAQLVVATVLTLLVVAMAARRAPTDTDWARALCRGALGLLCVGSLAVVASAVRRMALYVDAFGLTRTRLLVVFAEVALAAVLVLVMAAGVRWRGGWLPRAVVQVAAVAMLALAAVNPDAQILRHNATADLEGPVDLVYLQELSADAIPAAALLDEPLRSCLLDRRRPQPAGGFAAWNLGRSRADAARAGGGAVASGATACAEYADSRVGNLRVR